MRRDGGQQRRLLMAFGERCFGLSGGGLEPGVGNNGFHDFCTIKFNRAALKKHGDLTS
jgi:hypothetical protein